MTSLSSHHKFVALLLLYCASFSSIVNAGGGLGLSLDLSGVHAAGVEIVDGLDFGFTKSGVLSKKGKKQIENTKIQLIDLTKTINSSSINDQTKAKYKGSIKYSLSLLKRAPKPHAISPKSFGLEPFNHGGGAVSQLFKLRKKPGKLFKLEGNTLQTEQKIPTPSSVAFYFGIPTFGARLSNRAVASYRVDQLLGTNILHPVELAVLKRTDSSEAHINTIAGILMDKISSNKKLTKKFTSKKELDELLDKHRIQKSKLILVDYITNQHDRHYEDIFYNIKNKKFIAIDHDFSFALKTSTKDYPYPIDDKWWRGKPKRLDRLTIKKVKSLKKSDLDKKLSMLLTRAEIDATWERVEEVKSVIKSKDFKYLGKK